MRKSIYNTIIISDVLSGESVVSTAPCRIDCGGTWDLKPFALPYYYIKPTTVNIAINLRTKVEILPFQEGWTKVSSKGFISGI